MSIFEYNGSALVAMAGNKCLAIASDCRLTTYPNRICKLHDKLYIGVTGLSDVPTLYKRLLFRHKLYRLREERDMKPETFANIVSAVLYEKNLAPHYNFCQPAVIAGLGEGDEPFICSTKDWDGSKNFAVSGTASESLYGACESMYKPNMEPEELSETISRALLSSVDRDCLSGLGGGYVIVVTPTQVQERTLKGKRV